MPWPSTPTSPAKKTSIECLAKRLARFGRLDVLVNNAGRSMRGKVLDTTPEQFRDLMELNLIALVRCTRAAVPELLRRQGHVVNIGSLASKAASRWVGAYPATKHAVAAYSQQLRLELGPQGLHVLLVCPGPIERKDPRLYPLEGLEDVPERGAARGGGQDPGDSAAAACPGDPAGVPSSGGPSWSFPALRGCCSPFPSFGPPWATGSCYGRRRKRDWGLGIRDWRFGIREPRQEHLRFGETERGDRRQTRNMIGFMFFRDYLRSSAVPSLTFLTCGRLLWP